MKKRSLTVLATVLMAVGLMMTLENYSIIDGISKLWPLFLLILSAGFAILFSNDRKKDPALAWISAFALQLGLFFFYLNYTSWGKLSSLWTVFLLVFGMSFLAAGVMTRKRVMIYIALAFIIVFPGLFLVFTISLRMWPMSLVVLGLSLLIVQYFPSEKAKKKRNEK